LSKHFRLNTFQQRRAFEAADSERCHVGLMLR
jgi:hypothetical protein